MRVPRVFVALLLVLPALSASTPATWAGDGGPVPERNTAFVKAGDAGLRQAWGYAGDAIAEGDWDAAVRHLQGVVDAKDGGEGEGTVAADVLPVSGSVVYEGAWIVAHHRILAGGQPALEAYERVYGSEAATQLRRALDSRDQDGLASVADRFLPLLSGRRAALLLADLALEAGDRDRALGWLQRLEDVEEVSAEGEESLATWRKARIRRAAVAIGRPGRRDAVVAHLERSSASTAEPRDRYAPVPSADRPPPPRLTSWPTRRGDAARAAIPPGLGGTLEFAWSRGFMLAPLEADEPYHRPRGPRPSPRLLPSAAVDWPLVFASDGALLYAWDLKSGRLAGEPFTHGDVYDRPSDPDDEQKQLGLLEGFSLTLGPKSEAGRFLYLSAPEVTDYDYSWDYDNDRDDEMVAVWWNGRRFEERWRLGGDPDFVDAPEGVPEETRFYGAPLLYRDRLWVAALRPATEVDAEAWLYGLDPVTGVVETRTYLGTGGPPRLHRPDEAVPSSPAGRAGRVVVTTNLGLVAAVDARTGRPLWIFRNHRGVKSGGRPPDRLGTEPDGSARESGFVNQPPLLALERVYVAPTDGPELLSLHDRPRGPERVLVAARRRGSEGFDRFTAEQVAGLHPGTAKGPAVLVVVGRGGAGEGGMPAPIAVGLDPLTLAPRGWEAHATTGHGPVPYGSALVTAEEVLIPTRHGIGIHALDDGRDVGTVDVSVVSPDLLPLLPAEIPLFGNLLPVPGRGLLVLNSGGGVFWRIRSAR